MKTERGSYRGLAGIFLILAFFAVSLPVFVHAGFLGEARIAEAQRIFSDGGARVALAPDDRSSVQAGEVVPIKKGFLQKCMEAIFSVFTRLSHGTSVSIHMLANGWKNNSALSPAAIFGIN